MSYTSKQLSNIWFLRYAAAIIIVIYHYNGTVIDSIKFQTYNHYLSAGVDLFFMISGYLMAKALQSPNQTSQKFLIARLRKIYPLFFVLTITLFSFDLYFDIFPNRTLDWKTLAMSLTFTTFFATEITQLIAVAWTLEYEIYFYFCVALCFHAKSYELRILGLTSLVVLVVLVTNDILFLEFLFGVIIFLFQANSKGVLKYLVTAAVVLILFWLIDSVDHRIVKFGVPMLLLFALSFHLNGFFRIPNKLPNVSYEIYLIHVYFIKFFITLNLTPSSYSLTLTAVLISCFTSAFLWMKLDSLMKKA